VNATALTDSGRTLVIDTNLWVSRLLLPGGVAARAVNAALAWGTPLMSEATLVELSEVLSRRKFDRYVTPADRQQFLRLLGGVVRMVSITQTLAVCRDPADDKFLDVALTGQARLILTGDADLLALHPFHGVDILRPAEFLAQVVRLV